MKSELTKRFTMRWLAIPKTFDTVEEFWTWRDIEAARERAGHESLTRFLEAFGRFLGVPQDRLWLMPSGHQGLEWLLRCRLDTRRQVLVPAFNCSVVQDAIEAAGYQSRLYDFSPQPGQFDWEQVISAMDDETGVLIVTHYFGVPVNFRPVLEACEQRGIVVIEDCAHTLGGLIGDQLAGTLGDASVFSFNYDKPISLGWGGVSVINNVAAFDAVFSDDYRVPKPGEEIGLLHDFVEAMDYRRKMIPRRQSISLRLLRRVLMTKYKNFCKDPSLSIGPIQAELGKWCLSRYSDALSKRIANANYLGQNIKQSTWHCGSDTLPAWVKQKVYIRNKGDLSRVSSRLQREGLRCGNFNWPVLIGDGRNGDYPHAYEAASLWMDVPIHQNLEKINLDQVISLLSEID